MGNPLSYMDCKIVPIGQLRMFQVVTPEWDPYSSYSDEPPEPGCDVMTVYARTKKRAKVLAVRAWRRNRRTRSYRDNYIIYTNGDGSNPFTGLKVYDYTFRGAIV